MASSSRVIVTVGVLVALQVGAVLAYRAVEDGRRVAPARPFAVERLASAAAAPVVEVERGGAALRVPSGPGPVVLVHFWATWCLPCREELPGLLALGERLKRAGGFELWAISVDDDWATVERYFDGQVPASVVRAREVGAAARYGVATLPDSYLVDRAGRLVERFGGARDWRTPAAAQHLQERIDD